MKPCSRVVLVAVLLALCALGVQAQSDTYGKLPSVQKSTGGIPQRGTSDVESFPLEGPLFPPPLGVNFLSIPGTPGAAGRVGGNNWYFSGCALSGNTDVWWGAVSNQVILSLDGSFPFNVLTFGPPSNLAAGVAVWSGSSLYWNKADGSGPISATVSFVLTVTDSATGAPVSLTNVVVTGLPGNVGGCVPVTPGLHYRANLQFLVNGQPALDWFDTYADGTHGPVISSFTAGFYWGGVALDPVSFGNVLVGNAPVDSVTIHNYRAGTLTVAPGATSTDAAFSAPSYPSTPIASMGSAKFPVQFTAAVGPHSASIIYSHDGVSSPDSATVSGTGVMQVVLQKERDADGNPLTTFDQTPVPWQLAFYADSVTLGTLIAQGAGPQLTINNLLPGTYIAVEADSGASWTRINGNTTRYDTIILTTTPVTIDTFVNFRPNTLTVRKFRDNDGQFATSGDRVPHLWHLEIHRDSANGALASSADGTTLSNGNLGDGTYYAVEADSGLWIHLGYVIDGIPTASSARTAAVVLANGQASTVDFVNAPPIYGAEFRSFNADSIALDVDNKGKVNKPVKRKAVRVDFCAQVVNSSLGADGLHMEFSAALDTSFPFFTVPGSTKVGDLKLKKWDFTFNGAIPLGDTVRVYGMGKIGKPIKVSKYFWKVGATAGASFKNPLIDPNAPRDPMPNRVNALQDAYALGAFTSTAGLQAGRNRLGPPDSSKFYGWVTHKKYGDVMKSLYVSKLVPHTHDGPPAGFNFVKKKGNLPKSKQNNRLFANMVALRLNIAASNLGITPPGLGSLIYDNGAGNPMNGKSVGAIADFADSLIMGYYLAGVHQFALPAEFDSVNAAIGDINNAFEGPLDTVSFALSLEFTGSRPLYQVAYLHADSTLLPTQIRPAAAAILEAPSKFELSANYPNPFNPTTTIEFSLAAPSRVTLKIYDILGREVATLINRESYDEGSDEVTFDASNLSSGVYIYRLVAEPFTDEETGATGAPLTRVRKMILMK